VTELQPLQFFARLKWIDGRPLLSTLESYRRRLFEQFFAPDPEARRYRYNLGLVGRAKKNWKTVDLVLACLYALMADSPGGNQVYIVANDEDQSADDLTLAKKLIKVNSLLDEWVRVKKNVIERRDGEGFIEILPAQDAVGAHGKTYRLLGIDEIHGYRNWDLLEALAPDPTRRDTQTWITSYATLFHRPGVPLFDLLKQAKAGTDPSLLLSWYAADFCTDPDFADKSPEERANPSMASWGNPDYLAQQQRRLPAHKYRRLHLNLPGLPEGSAYQPEPIMDAIARGVRVRNPEPGISYRAFVDMSGGSSDDAVLGISHRDVHGKAVLDCIQDQGPRPPFDPNAAVTRFVETARAYRITRVCGDRYAGETFRRQFEEQGISYDVAGQTKSELYDALEPLLNSHGVVLLDLPTLEQQLLGLVWRGGRIDHASGEHDDYANAAAGALVGLSEQRRMYWDKDRQQFVQDLGITI
jgi:phage terminase large subunit-like protein